MFLFFFYHLVIVSKIIRSFIPSVHFHRRAKQISVSFNTQEPSQTERSCENTQYIPSSSSLLKTKKNEDNNINRQTISSSVRTKVPAKTQ